MQGQNEVHVYSQSLLGYNVILPINGDTDSHVVAAFHSRSEANEYCKYLNVKWDGQDAEYRVTPVGTLHRDTDGQLIR